MCGICGIIHFDSKEVEKPILQKMMRKMKHRGPDDKGTFTDKNIGLGFVRLSILDLTIAGHQPMFDNSGRYCIVFNGEIYNYIELREELEHEYSFKSQTDTEVILASYIKWGEECLHRFNGMWAFALYDRKTRRLFAARDRYGIKPYYYIHTKDGFFFASDVSSILEAVDTSVEQDNQTIYDYLVFNRTHHSERTFFKNIQKLQHGHKLIINGTNVKIQQWYYLEENIGLSFHDEHEFKESLASSIQLRLRSDVPIGSCLSGGIDSSSIVSTIIHEFKDKNLNTFSSIYGTGIRGDESSFINLYRKTVQNMHFSTPTAESLFHDLDVFIEAHQEPVTNTSPYAEFKLMELAKESVTVVLNGQGADEMLGGYHYFFGFYFKELFNRLKWIKLLKEVFSSTLKQKSTYGLQSLLFLMLPHCLKTKKRTRDRIFLNREFVSLFSAQNTEAERIYQSPTLHKALLDHFQYKFEHHLMMGDRSSMWFSLELRFPFLDYRLVEKTLALPGDRIIRNGNTKHILRKAMKNMIPEEIRLRRDKIGFETPESEWFRKNIFREFIQDILHSSLFKQRGYVDPKKALKLYQDHLDGKKDISGEIWKWINLELWFQKYINNKFA